MYQLEKLQIEQFDEVWEIMEDSFPIDERRTKEDQRNLMKESIYSIYGYRNGEELAAFLAVWELDDFVFVEHFAVKKTARNGGLGAKLLQQLLQQIGKAAVLEVELPENELACRRIGFYERNGFVQNAYPYTQPALSDVAKPIALQIMSRPKALNTEEFTKVRDALYREVYKMDI